MPVNLPHAEGEIFSATVITAISSALSDVITLLTSGHRARVRQLSIAALTTSVFPGGALVELWRGTTGVSTGAAVSPVNVTNPATGAPTGANFAVAGLSTVPVSTASAARLHAGAVLPDGFVFRPPVEQCPVVSSSQRLHARVTAAQLTTATGSLAISLQWEDLGKMPGF